eukprot:CAMPEP_0204002706 /NCGR_PEP_ID=MMETSP0360-20130528/17099_1 /ASSEMBLY_ACC=CAM_ASM_000342 /TAXON_ID=268821 /ORGANISM="Scrippsiella Hangoei, Strain SHTV-5" /LENGTH=65 /DNA_ID=CAMNT_0050944343 /DNA_START=166 /DNA_END=359 /DNA_ORIENTATION=+
MCQRAVVEHEPPDAFAAAARRCLRQADKMIDALAFQRVVLTNCQAHVVEERPSDAPELSGRRPTR